MKSEEFEEKYNFRCVNEVGCPLCEHCRPVDGGPEPWCPTHYCELSKGTLWVEEGDICDAWVRK